MLRAHPGLPTFRERAAFAQLSEAIRGASASPSVGTAFRVIAFSVQKDHLQLIVEAHDEDTLSRGTRGLSIRCARAINRAFGTHGPVWGDRYAARDLTTPHAMRAALVYVLMNAKKHGVRLASGIDAYSSAPWFDGFAAHVPREDESPVQSPRTQLGATGWRRGGLLRADELPGESDPQSFASPRAKIDAT